MLILLPEIVKEIFIIPTLKTNDKNLFRFGITNVHNNIFIFTDLSLISYPHQKTMYNFIVIIIIINSFPSFSHQR